MRRTAIAASLLTLAAATGVFLFARQDQESVPKATSGIQEIGEGAQGEASQEPLTTRRLEWFSDVVAHARVTKIGERFLATTPVKGLPDQGLYGNRVQFEILKDYRGDAPESVEVVIIEESTHLEVGKEYLIAVSFGDFVALKDVYRPEWIATNVDGAWTDEDGALTLSDDEVMAFATESERPHDRSEYTPATITESEVTP